MIKTINDKTLTVFEMTGNDVVTFLNNQVVSELRPNSSTVRLSAICNPKGRILFTLILQIQPESSLVAVDTSLCDNFLQYINMRRFRMDVKVNKSISKIAIECDSNETDLGQAMMFTHDGNLPATEASDFWLFMFAAGLPWITFESSEAFIPQHLNLDQLSVIDFDKGCYPGQEIVARLHFLGQVKKRMQYIQYQADQAYTILSKLQIPEYDMPLEVCSPAVLCQGKWHSQAIIKTSQG